MARTGTGAAHEIGLRLADVKGVGTLGQGETTPPLTVDEKGQPSRQHRGVRLTMLGNEARSLTARLRPKMLKCVSPIIYSAPMQYADLFFFLFFFTGR